MSLIRKLFVCSKAPSAGDRGPAYKAKDAAGAGRKHGDGDTGSDTEGSQAEAECAVCQDRLTEPCTVPCGNRHVFCLACLKGVITHNSHRSNFPCPLCRKRVRIPIGGVSAFRNNKTLGQKLRAKFPDLRPRSRHRRRRSRSALRSTEYVTVSFPVLGYSDDLDLQLDILSTIYSAHHGPQPVNHGRVVDVLLDEIGQVQERPSPSRPQEALWLSEDADDSDSDQEDDRNATNQQAVSTRTRPPANEDPRLGDAEDLDMSVVLQIIADMEENERRREAVRGTAQTPAAHGVLTPRSESGSVLQQASRSGNSRSPRSEHGGSDDHTSCRQTNTNAASLLTPEHCQTSRRQDTGRPGTERPESSSGTPKRPETRSTTSQRPESSSGTPKRPETKSATSQRPETSNSASQRGDVSSVSSQRLETSIGASHRSGNGAANSSVTEQDRPQTTNISSQTSGRGRASSSPRPQPDTATADGLCTDTVTSETSETCGNSPQRSNTSQPAPEKTSRGKSKTRQHNDRTTSDKSKSPGARSQKSDRNSTGKAAPSSPLQRSSPESPASDDSREPCPFGDKAESGSTEDRSDTCAYRWMPRPRMGSFKLAIAAGQTSPPPYEESPPLFPTPPQDQTPVSAVSATRDHGASSSPRELELPPAVKTKKEIRERPFRIKYHTKQTLRPDPGLAADHRGEELLVHMMDSVDREDQEKLTSPDGGDSCYREGLQRPRTTPTAREGSTARNGAERPQQTDWKLHELQCNDTENARSQNEDLSMPCQSDTSELTTQASELRRQEGREGRRSGQNQEQTLNSPPDGFQPDNRRHQERNHRSRQTTTPTNNPRDKTSPRPVTVSGAEFQEQCQQLPPARRDPDDSEEWTRRIRGLQRRVISQTWNRPASGDGHSVGGAQGSAASVPHHPHTFNTPADDCAGGADTPNTGASVIHV